MPEEEPPHVLNALIDAAVLIVGPLVVVVASPHEPPSHYVDNTDDTGSIAADCADHIDRRVPAAETRNWWPLPSGLNGCIAHIDWWSLLCGLSGCGVHIDWWSLLCGLDCCVVLIDWWSLIG